MVRLPGWLVFLIFFPLQLWLALKLWQSEWPWWAILLGLAVVGFLGNRAASVPWIQQLLFPRMAAQREARRHVYQGILLVGAVVIALLAWGPKLHWPVEGLPLMTVIPLVALLKASVR